MNRSGFAWEKLLDAAIASNVETALAEDVGTGDLTASLFPPDELVSGHLIVREKAVLSGIPWFDAVMHRLDSRIAIQ
ncbi:MAG: nicotinate-nucleotide diphosphorylase (carboxylating), partial [Oxalobacter sp.]|nr:nicotinate-nucleotide diphosphorylase (carboxylating) [Oxalobacter sp.]